ncbi:MAG: FmdB family zinc ribbon protein [Planctomycetota bacterium]|jgi:putative FmdB family regulatory protein
MPIYEYHCLSCEKDVELLVRTANARPECPECGSKELERLFSTFAAHQGGSSAPAGRCPAGQAGQCAKGSCPLS